MLWPHGKHPTWFCNLYKQAFQKFQALKALGPSAPADDSGGQYSPLNNIGQVLYHSVSPVDYS